MTTYEAHPKYTVQMRIDDAREAGLEGLARYYESRRDRTDAKSLYALRLYGIASGAFEGGNS